MDWNRCLSEFVRGAGPVPLDRGILSRGGRYRNGRALAADVILACCSMLVVLGVFVQILSRIGDGAVGG